MSREFDHPARYLVPEQDDAGHRLCTVCSHPLEGEGSYLRHQGEAQRMARPVLASDAPVIRDAEKAVERVLASTPWSAAPTAADRSKAIVAELYQQGLLPARRRRPPGADL